jgi:hypothetical protein
MTSAQHQVPTIGPERTLAYGIHNVNDQANDCFRLVDTYMTLDRRADSDGARTN